MSCGCPGRPAGIPGALIDEICLKRQPAPAGTCGGHASYHQPWGHRIYSDPVPPLLGGKRAREAFQSGLGGTVIGATGVAVRRNTRDIDDPAPTRSTHVRNDGPCRKERAPQMNALYQVPIFSRHFRQIHVTREAGVVHENVGPADLFRELSYSRIDSFLISNIRRRPGYPMTHGRETSGGLAATGLINVEKPDRISVACKPAGDGCANASRCPSDDCCAHPSQPSRPNKAP